MKLRALVTSAVVMGVALPVMAGVLHPEMKPVSGTHEKPAAALGSKPASAWSSTTVEAAPDHKPVSGKIITVSGEVIDISCYMQVGKHGEKHKDCGQKCLKNGAPMGLLTRGGDVYLLMEEEHHPRRDGRTNLRATAIDHMGDIISVTGTATSVGGNKALYVQGYTTPAPA